MNRHNFRRSVLALGAESKGVFCLAKGRKLFISKDFGNLGDYDNFQKYQRAIRRNLNIQPKIIACDMHPDYNSTAFAQDLNSGSRLVKIQHHHAHVASCMADNGLEGRVIGVAFDGTGYGPDENIWGGEFLISSFNNFKRAAHLKYIPMPGGDAAIREPWRMGAAYLQDSFGDSFLDLDIPFTKKINKNNWHILKNALAKNINSPLTSSIGRLFDGAASILISVFKVNNEAQAAIRLQQLAQEAKYEEGRYKNIIKKEKDGFVIDPKGIIKGMVKDIKSKSEPSSIAARFHNTISDAIRDTCVNLRNINRINEVVLSGGVFQNWTLTEKSRKALKKKGFKVYTHRRSPATDAGISFGQAMIADARCKKCA